jgi:hypothetical protein
MTQILPNAICSSRTWDEFGLSFKVKLSTGSAIYMTTSSARRQMNQPWVRRPERQFADVSVKGHKHYTMRKLNTVVFGSSHKLCLGIFQKHLQI